MNLQKLHVQMNLLFFIFLIQNLQNQVDFQQMQSGWEQKKLHYQMVLKSNYQFISIQGGNELGNTF